MGKESQGWAFLFFFFFFHLLPLKHLSSLCQKWFFKFNCGENMSVCVLKYFLTREGAHWGSSRWCNGLMFSCVWSMHVPVTCNLHKCSVNLVLKGPCSCSKKAVFALVLPLNKRAVRFLRGALPLPPTHGISSGVVLTAWGSKWWMYSLCALSSDDGMEDVLTDEAFTVWKGNVVAWSQEASAQNLDLVYLWCAHLVWRGILGLRGSQWGQWDPTGGHKEESGLLSKWRTWCSGLRVCLGCWVRTAAPPQMSGEHEHPSAWAGCPSYQPTASHSKRNFKPCFAPKLCF